MALYEIKIYKNPASLITTWLKGESLKEAYEYGIKIGTDTFGDKPDSIIVNEDKPN
jgi:hypothetical protein